MDLVLVGLPGSGKTAVGRRVAARHGAAFVDLDEQIEHAAGRRIPEIFEAEGEAAFRQPGARGGRGARPARPRPGAAARDLARRRGDRRPAQPLDAVPRPARRLARRAPRGPRPAPAALAPTCARWSRAATPSAGSARWRPPASGSTPPRRGSTASPSWPGSIEAVDRLVAAGGRRRAPRCSRGDADRRRRPRRAASRSAAVERGSPPLEARRAILVSEPGAWAAFGAGVAAGLRADGWPVERVMLPAGEAAKRARGDRRGAARELARLRVERREPLVAVGGGALGDAAGFLAATYLRGVPWIQVPTTLVAQVDSSIGGKTGVDLPEGKNLVGAFHQPSAIVIDIAALASLPERQRRAALGEVVKMAALGDEALFATLEADGEAIAGRRRGRRVGRAGRGRRAGRLGEGRGRHRGRARAGRGRRPDHAQPGPHGRPRARGGRRLRDAAPRRGGRRTACGRRPGSAPRVGATPRRPRGAHRGAARRPRPRRRPRSRSPRRGPRSHRQRQEARRRAPALGPADRRRASSCATTCRTRSSPSAVASVIAGRGRPPRPVPRSRRDPGPRPPGPEPQHARDARAGDVRPRDAGRDPRRARDAAAELGLDVVFFQSNHEGALIDRLHERDFDAAIVNAGGLTHTSIALRDALLAIERPFVEVHLTDPSTREPFRQVSYLQDIAQASIVGQKSRGYHVALEDIAVRAGDGR